MHLRYSGWPLQGTQVGVPYREKYLIRPTKNKISK
jgi:hypothetical protein